MLPESQLYVTEELLLLCLRSTDLYYSWPTADTHKERGVVYTYGVGYTHGVESGIYHTQGEVQDINRMRYTRSWIHTQSGVHLESGIHTWSGKWNISYIE